VTAPIKAADLFCGAGGTSTGLLHACNDLGFTLDLVAVNHWPLAIQTHLANHPWARHVCASLMPIEPDAHRPLFETGVDAIDPRKAVPSGKLDLLVASPECTHFSNARGGKPRSEQSRATPWCILRWADALRPDSILIENVPEFKTWGPLTNRGELVKARKGETFAAFLNALASLGYNVDHRVLCAADYGDATTRKRLFIQAMRGNRKVVWPDHSHSKDGAALPRWRPAREIIDWSISGKSIFERKKPLSAKTIERIAAGLRKFCGESAEPFLVMLYGTNNVRTLNRPLPTVTAGGQHIGLAQPFLVQYHGGEDFARRLHPVTDPLPVQDCSNRYALCEPFVLGQQSKSCSRSVNDPVPTICTKGAISLIQPFLMATGQSGANSDRIRGVDEPLPTVMTKAEHCLVEPYLLKYYGNGQNVHPVTDPIGTITTKDRFGLVQPFTVQAADGNTYALDIRFRMLEPHELAAAMGFPAEYEFAGTKEMQVRQIGGAVPVEVARALLKRQLVA